MKILVFNADDFGYSKETNTAIVSSLRTGIIKSLTVMANMPFADEVIEALKKFPEISIGVHLNLTEGRPVLPPEQVPSLVDTNGNFFTNHRLLTRCIMGRIKHEEIKAELRTQILRAKDLVGNISHVDSHQNIHPYPRVLSALIVVLKELQINYIRSQRQLNLYNIENKLLTSEIGRFMRNLVKNTNRIKLRLQV